MKKTATLFTISVLLLLALFVEASATSNASASSGSDDWPMFHHDPMHGGYSTSTAPSTNLTIWKYKTGGWVGSPIAANGKVYVTSNDGDVYCLDAFSGAFVWSYNISGSAESTPAIAEGNVYVGSADKNVYCLDALTGAKVWNYTTGDQVQSSPLVTGGIVYVGSDDQNVYALNVSNGALIWNYTTGNEFILHLQLQTAISTLAQTTTTSTV